jgi:hypothetical protein
VAKTAVANEDFLSAFNGRGIGDRAGDEHVAAWARSGGGRGLGNQGSRRKQSKSRKCFHATSYSFTSGGWRPRRTSQGEGQGMIDKVADTH